MSASGSHTRSRGSPSFLQPIPREVQAPRALLCIAISLRVANPIDAHRLRSGASQGKRQVCIWAVMESASG
eukprot:3764322-Amphidinium_carterae.1